MAFALLVLLIVSVVAFGPLGILTGFVFFPLAFAIDKQERSHNGT